MWMISIHVEDINTCEGYQYMWRISIHVEDINICGGCGGHPYMWRISIHVEDINTCQNEVLFISSDAFYVFDEYCLTIWYFWHVFMQPLQNPVCCSCSIHN